MFSREQNVLQFYVQEIQSIIATHFGTYYFPKKMGRILEILSPKYAAMFVTIADRFPLPIA